MAEVEIETKKNIPDIEVKNEEQLEQKENYEEVISPPRHKETNYTQNNDFLNRIEEATLNIKEKDTFGNASPLGYFAYGMDLFIYSLAVAGVYEIDSLVISDCLCIGGIAQATAGIFSFVQGKTVEASIFLLYSFMNLMICTNQIFTHCTWAPAITTSEYAAFYSFWALLSLGLFGLTFKKNVILTALVLSMLLMQIMRTIGYGLTSNGCFITAGVFGVISSVCSIYLAYAELLNETYEKKVLPLFWYKTAENDKNK